MVHERLNQHMTVCDIRPEDCPHCGTGAVSASRGNARPPPAVPAAEPTAALLVSAVTQGQEDQQNAADAWADSVLGGLEVHPPCQHRLMGPCITVSEMTRIEGSCGPDITNHSKRHKDYRRF
ncbi:hypothetical protein OS493_038382 [Desmophyllum pertusum]|uniref:Uncharacterized protein n=1 Tax=Desmophyllum pertusum TaxID=174260 RepID=A0A9X0CTU7_9CNID|nr:hypothetical protein OS493_038382 [Desmophyllum pertusum]